MSILIHGKVTELISFEADKLAGRTEREAKETKMKFPTVFVALLLIVLTQGAITHAAVPSCIVDAIIFTAGVGEHAPLIREKSCQGLSRLGIEIDAVKNAVPGGGIREISSSDSEVKVLVIPTNEELEIARETQKAIENV